MNEYKSSFNRLRYRGEKPPNYGTSQTVLRNTSGKIKISNITSSDTSKIP